VSIASFEHPSDKTRSLYFVAEGSSIRIFDTNLKPLHRIELGGTVTQLLVSTRYLVAAYTSPLAEGIPVDVGRI